MAQQAIGIDIGTTKIAAVALNLETGSIVTECEANSSLCVGLADGWHEQDPQKILECCLLLLNRLARNPLCPASDWQIVGFSGQMHGVLLVDAQVLPLTNFITWCDQRAVGVVSSVENNKWSLQRTGCYLHAGYGGATLGWLAQNGKIAAGAVALTIADFLALNLCGGAKLRKRIDRTHAASWGIFDLGGNCWDSDSLGLLGISSDCLPEIADDMDVVGEISVEVAEQIGLAPGQKVGVVQPVGDNQASYIGTCGMSAEYPLLNLGTGGQLSLPLQRYSCSAETETRPLPGGGYLLVCASLCGGRAYALLKDCFAGFIRELTGNEPDINQIYQIINRLASQVESMPPERLLCVDTRFAGTRMKTGLRGSISNIAVDNFTAGHLAYGVICGMIDELVGMAGRGRLGEFSKAYVSGNALARNPLARKLAETQLGLQCVCADGQEEAATGAARLATRVLA